MDKVTPLQVLLFSSRPAEIIETTTKLSMENRYESSMLPSRGLPNIPLVPAEREDVAV